MRIAGGLFTDADLRSHATVLAGDELLRAAFGAEIVGVPPNSRHLVLGIAACRRRRAAYDPEDPEWAHVLIEAATAASHDRPALLHDGADDRALLGAVQHAHG